MRLGQDDDVIEALAADAPQKSFAHRVHERPTHGRAQDANAGAAGHAVEGLTELVVAVANEELRTLPKRRRIAKLLRGPRLRWSARQRDGLLTPPTSTGDLCCPCRHNPAPTRRRPRRVSSRRPCLGSWPPSTTL
jgi:hypothetical protein